MGLGKYLAPIVLSVALLNGGCETPKSYNFLGKEHKLREKVDYQDLSPPANNGSIYFSRKSSPKRDIGSLVDLEKPKEEREFRGLFNINY